MRIGSSPKWKCSNYIKDSSGELGLIRPSTIIGGACVVLPSSSKVAQIGGTHERGEKRRFVFVAFRPYHAIIKWRKWWEETVFNTFDETPKRWPPFPCRYRHVLQYRLQRFLGKRPAPF
ncbi:hypothetical protein Zmor_009024 [Zophobas morio]|uniref:Uncharacterized protein n=1 Tax=Zophobas morio TaxID=2755281 RepID=A0AA38LZ14_9CUCU|nr:hypothetical protein Zmor_009024 [Zophobas morio]